MGPNINNMMSSMGINGNRNSGRSSSTGIFGGGSRGGGKNDIIPKGYRSGTLQQFTPEQLELFSQMFGYLGPDSDLSKLASGDESMFNQMEAPALRQFSGLQGNIASRFSGMGMGGRRSSGFQNTMNAASSDFAQDLASKRQELSRQALMDMFGMSQMLFNQKPYERILAPKEQKEPGFWQQLGSNFAGQAGKSAGKFLFGG